MNRGTSPTDTIEKNQLLLGMTTRDCCQKRDCGQKRGNVEKEEKEVPEQRNRCGNKDNEYR